MKSKKFTLIMLLVSVPLAAFCVSIRLNRDNKVTSTPLPPSLIGDYSWGWWWMGGHLTLNSDGTYTLGSHSDAKDPRDPTNERGKYEGIVEVKGDTLQLISKKDKKRNRTYSIVLWDKRTYLISSEGDGGFQAFVDAIKAGTEPATPPQNSPFMVHVSEKNQDKIPEGLPKFPKEQQHLLKGVKRIQTDIPPSENFATQVIFAAAQASKRRDDKKAKHYAQLIFSLGSTLSSNPKEHWHDARIILGLAALRKGDIASAKGYLTKACAADAIIQDRTCSPYKELLQGLYAKGERQAALDYVSTVETALSDPKTPKRWVAMVRTGKIPDMFRMMSSSDLRGE